MTWQDRWIFKTFGRVLVLRWARRIATAGFIAMAVLAVAAVIEELGYVSDRLLTPAELAWSAGGAFAVCALAALTGAYALGRRLR
jgi:hypothetical protein